MNQDMKRRYYFKLVISEFLEEHFGEVVDERLAALLRSKIESRPNHNNEFKVRLTNGNLSITHLGIEFCSSNS